MTGAPRPAPASRDRLGALPAWLCAGSALAVLLFVGMAHAGRGSIGHLVLAFLAIHAGAFAFLLGLSAAAVGLQTLSTELERRALAVAGAAFALTLALAGAALSAFPGVALSRSELDAAFAHCESLVPLLEAHRAEHGAYPAALDELDGFADVPPPPRRLRRWKRFYWGGVERFQLTFPDQDAHFWFADWVWDSDEPGWRHEVD